MSLRDLKTLVLSHHPLIIIETLEECRAAELVENASEELFLPMFEWSLSRGLCERGAEKPIHNQTLHPLQALRAAELMDVPAIFLFKDLDSNLEDQAIRRCLRDICTRFRQSPSCIILVGNDHPMGKELEHEAVHYQIGLPSRDDLGSLLKSTIASVRERQSVDVDLDADDEFAMVSSLQGMTINQARQSIIRAIVEDNRLDGRDVENIQKMKASVLRDGGLLEYYPPEDNSHEMGGFDNLCHWLNRAALGFSPKARALNLEPPKGILLVGVQGCGKSLAARVIAREWAIPLLKLDAGSLYDKYVGESEKNFRHATQMAEAMAPCVLWMDEMEKAFAVGGDGSTDGGTSQRILATFLTWMQEKEESVFLVGTANNVDRMPPELMRKGRFDEIFFVDLPTALERREILEIHLQRRKQNVESFDLDSLVEHTDGFSGAEIEQAIIAGLYRSLEKDEDMNSQTLVEEVFSTVPLSISRREDVDRLRIYARDRFVPATSVPEPADVAEAA